MAALVRTRQGEFELGRNVLGYEDLEEGEEVWRPRVGDLLLEWQASEQRKEVGGVGGEEVNDGEVGGEVEVKKGRRRRRNSSSSQER